MSKENLESKSGSDPLSLASGGNDYFLGKNKFFRISVSTVKDEVDGVYAINFQSPLPQLDTSSAKAYSVTNKQDKNKNNLYAIVLNKKYPIRLEEINKLSGQNLKNFCNVISFQVIPTSLGKGRNFVVILEKPEGIKLSEYLQKNGAISEDAIIKRVIPALNEPMKFFIKKGIVHGKINLDNVYINEVGDVVLGECISEICGFSQPAIYEDINRASTLPFAKGRGITAMTDYHAMGVLSAILLRGKNPVEGMLEKEVVLKKYTENTYKIVTDLLELSPHMLDFLRGVIVDKAKDIWTGEQVDEWIKGRRYNLLPPAENVEAGRPIMFSNNRYWNKKHLSYGLYCEWEEAKKFIREDTLVRWIERSVKDVELCEKMEVLSHRTGTELVPTFDKNDELLSQYLLLLDPGGPIKLKGFCAMIDGIGPAMAYGHAHAKNDYLEAIQNIILYNLLSYWEGNKNSADGGLNSIGESIFVIQKCIDFLRKRDLGFGVDRCFYEMNPTLACQSQFTVDYAIFNTEELLKNLDVNESVGGGVLDGHMSAFLSNRLDLQTKIRVASLTKFPDVLANFYIQTLALLSMAQQSTSASSLPGLAGKVYSALKNFIEEFHSKAVRSEMNEAIQKASHKGSLALILKVVTDSKYLVRDRLGFKKSVTKYKNNAMQIAKLSNRKAVNNMGYRYGLQLAVMLSFFLATIVVIISMIKVF